MLARNGVPVVIFEASDKLGGCCATTTLGGYTFHDGAVYLALINVLDHAFAKVGLSRAERLPLRKITSKSSATMPDGTVVTLGDGLDLSVTGRTIDAKRIQSELRDMMDKWRPVLRFASQELLPHPFSSWRALQKGWRHLPKLRGTVASEFNRLFSDEAVKSALSGDLLYTGLPPEAMQVSAILGLVAEIDDGFYLPEGGMGRIPQVLHCGLQAFNAPTHFNSKVGKIIIRNRPQPSEREPRRYASAPVFGVRHSGRSASQHLVDFGDLNFDPALPSQYCRRASTQSQNGGSGEARGSPAGSQRG